MSNIRTAGHIGMDDKKLDLNLLVALEALLIELNVSRAAERLNMSQPALSAQLSKLRVIFDDPLLIPTSRGMLPTAAAIDLEHSLRLTLDQARAIITRVNSFDPATANLTFTVAACEYLQLTILVPLLRKLNQEAPGIRVMVRTGQVRAAVTELERGDVDVAMAEPGVLSGTGLHERNVLAEPFVGIARKHTLGLDTMSVDRFMGARHIAVSAGAEGFGGRADKAFSAIGLSRNIAFSVSSFVSLVEAVSVSDLLALAPRRLIDRYIDRVETFDLPVAVPDFKVAIIWHDRTHAHPAKIWFRNEIAAMCTAHQVRHRVNEKGDLLQQEMALRLQ